MSCLLASSAADGSLFVINDDNTVKRLNSEIYQVVKQIVLPSGASQPRIEVDPYRQLIWSNYDVFDFDVIVISGLNALSSSRTIDPLGNSIWIEAGIVLFRETYNDVGAGVGRDEIHFDISAGGPNGITANPDDVFLRSPKTICSLDGLFFELPFADLDLYLHTVVDDYLYMSYRPSVTE